MSYDEDDIVIERGEPTATIMKLDDDEQALFNELNVSKPKPSKPVKKMKPRKPFVPSPQEEIGSFTNPVKMSASAQDYSRNPHPPVFNEDDDEGMGGEEFEEEEQQQYQSVEDQPSAGYTSIEDEKADILNKLSRLEKKGHAVNKRLNAYSSIQDLRTELKRIMYSIEVEQSLRFSRRMLIACVTGVEFLNKRYNPFDIQLDGWSETVMENVDDYDNVFEELYNKYKTKVKIAPEIQLIMMLGGSAMMFHLTNSMFKSAIPNMGDVLKQNPDLVKNMMNAVKNTAQQQQQNPQPPSDPTQRPMRREMRGPGLDISSLMGGMMMPPNPVSSSLRTIEEFSPPPMNIGGGVDDDNQSVSDIVSVSGGDTKDVPIKKGRGRPKGSKQSVAELNL
jgi:hypothetical protein